MPGRRIEGREQIIEIAGRRIEIDFHRKPFDHLVDPLEVGVYKGTGIDLQVLDLARRRHRREYLSDEAPRLGTVIADVPAPAQSVKAPVEFTLESIDQHRVEVGEMRLVDHFIEAFLALNQEMEPPLTVFHIEGKEIPYPAWHMVFGGCFKFERRTVRTFV